MKSKQEIEARIKFFKNEIMDYKEFNRIEYKNLAKSDGGQFIIQYGERIKKNEAMIQELQGKINMLEWAMEGGE